MNQNSPTKSRRGGARPGAGRPPGAATKRTREIANMASKLKGGTPLEVMLFIMGAFVQAAKEVAEVDPAARLKLLLSAANVAGQAVPYMHAKLQAIEHSGQVDNS